MALARRKMPNNEPEPSEIDHDGIIAAVLSNELASVDFLLERNPALINAYHETTGVSPLMAAAGRGLERMAAHLLTKPGIDLEMRDFQGLSAVEHGRIYPKIVSMIMSARFPGMVWKEPKIAPV